MWGWGWGKWYITQTYGYHEAEIIKVILVSVYHTVPRQYDYWACYKNIHNSIICKCQQIRNDSNIHYSRMDDKLWYILILETIQQWNKWTIASLNNMAKFPRQNDELKTSNTSICGMCVCVCVCVCVYVRNWLCPTLCEPPGLYPARFLCPWSFPGKNTRVGCHFLLQGIFPDPGTEPVPLVSSVLASPSFTTLPHGKPHVWVCTQSRPALCDPMDYSLPDSSV